MTAQLNLFDLTPGDLAALERAGLVVPVGRTPDGRVTSYALTGPGKALLSNHTQRCEP